MNDAVQSNACFKGYRAFGKGLIGVARRNVIRATLLVIVLFAFALGSCACSSQVDNREAGRVFDHVITEQDVIDYLDDYRAGCATEDDADWAAWLEEKSTTPEDIRKEVVNYLAQNWLVERAAGLLNIAVSDEEVAGAIEDQKSQYASDLAWTRALINAGYTEEAYALGVKSKLLKQKIKDHFANDAQALPDAAKSGNAEPSDDTAVSEDAFNDFYKENVSDAQVAVEPMPEGLPYDVSLEEQTEQES